MVGDGGAAERKRSVLVSVTERYKINPNDFKEILRRDAACVSMRFAFLPPTCILPGPHLASTWVSRRNGNARGLR